MLVVVGLVVTGRTGRLAPLNDHLVEYDRLVELARETEGADSPMGSFALGSSSLPAEARRLMLDLNVAGLSTYEGWAWVRGRASMFTSTTRYTLAPGGDLQGHAVLALSGLGGQWVDGHLYRWQDFEPDSASARPNPRLQADREGQRPRFRQPSALLSLRPTAVPPPLGG